jgi:hypothetical protein
MGSRGANAKSIIKNAYDIVAECDRMVKAAADVTDSSRARVMNMLDCLPDKRTIVTRRALADAVGAIGEAMEADKEIFKTVAWLRTMKAAETDAALEMIALALGVQRLRFDDLGEKFVEHIKAGPTAWSVQVNHEDAGKHTGSLDEAVAFAKRCASNRKSVTGSLGYKVWHELLDMPEIERSGEVCARPSSL